MQQHAMPDYTGHCAWYCDREGGCEKYVVIGRYVDKAVLDAYKQIDTKQVRELTAGRNARAAQATLKIKKEHPTFRRVDFWWLDELAERIVFGRDNSVTVHWKCGLQTSAVMAIINNSHDPVYLAGRNKNVEAHNQSPQGSLAAVDGLPIGPGR